jgi:hypothetical protein
LQYRRYLATFINICIILFGWSIIFMGTYYENEMKDWFLNVTGNAFIGEWSATFVMTVVNIFIPELLALADELEAWDLASEMLVSELWKNFYTSLMNVVFFLILNFSGNWTTEEPLEPDSGIECKEDGLVDEWLKLLISEIVIRYALYLIFYVWVRTKSLIYEGFDWRGEFELGDEVVWLFTVEFIFWCA